MIRRKTHYLLIFMANWQKTKKYFTRNVAFFLFNFNFLNNKKIYQKPKKKIKKHIFKKIIKKKIIFQKK